MSSLRRVQPSEASGALFKGPSTPAGKPRSAQNVSHGPTAGGIVLERELRKRFLILLRRHVDRLRVFDTRTAQKFDGGTVDQVAVAFDIPPIVKIPNDPNPIFEHPLALWGPPRQAPDSEALSGAANPGCSRLSAGFAPHAAATGPILEDRVDFCRVLKDNLN
jgi:hypothetical protein